MLCYIELQSLRCPYVNYSVFLLESESSSSDKILLIFLGILLGIIFAATGYISKRAFQRFQFFSLFNQEIITNIKKIQRNMNLVGHVIKSYQGRRTAKVIGSHTNQVHILGNFLTFLFLFKSLVKVKYKNNMFYVHNYVIFKP